jgi:hypothetical protein
MNDFLTDVEALIESLLELDDTECMEDLIALFCYNNKVMPGSDEYEMLIEAFAITLCEKMSNRVITKFREHIDEYE